LIQRGGYIANQEQIINDHGLDIPCGNLSAAEITIHGG
jgi:hypothetical protein